jgi:hypothetical protein
MNRHVGKEIERRGATIESLTAVVSQHYDLRKAGRERDDLAEKWRRRQLATERRNAALAQALGKS